MFIFLKFFVKIIMTYQKFHLFGIPVMLRVACLQMRWLLREGDLRKHIKHHGRKHISSWAVMFKLRRHNKQHLLHQLHHLVVQPPHQHQQPQRRVHLSVGLLQHQKKLQRIKPT
jgi:hypothetical protein